MLQPATRPSGPQQNDAAVAKAARAAIADDENLDDADKRALRRAAGRVPLQRLPLSGLAANHTVPPMRIEEGSIVSLQQRIDHGRVPTAAQYGPSARQVRIPEKYSTEAPALDAQGSDRCGRPRVRHHSPLLKIPVWRRRAVLHPSPKLLLKLKIDDLAA